MKNSIVILFLGILIVTGCEKASKEQTSPLQYAPKDATILIKINDFDKATSDLQNNDFIKANTHLALVAYFKKIPKLKLHPFTTESLLCLSPEGKEDFGYTFITKFDPKQLETDSSSTATIIKETYNNTSFYEIKDIQEHCYAVKIDSMLIATSSKLLMENALNQYQRKSKNLQSIPKALQKAYDAIPTDQAIALLIDGPALKKTKNMLLPNGDFDFLSSCNSWIAIDATVNQNELYLDGIVMIKDSVRSTTGLFNNTLAQENTLAQITPIGAKGFTSYTYDDFEILKQNLAFYQDRILKDMPTTLDGLLAGASEIGSIALTKNRVFVVAIIDEQMDTKNVIHQDQKVYTYRSTPIFRFEDATLLSNILDPLVTGFDAAYFTILDSFIVFGSTQELLQTIITNYKNESVLSKTPGYEQLSEQLSDQSSVLMVGDVANLANTLAHSAAEEHQSDWKKLKTKNYPLAALQLVNETNFAHLHAILQKNSKKATAQSVAQIATTTLDNKLLNSPQLVKNHRTKGMDIVAQDISNNLYLLSEKGNVFWKKQLDGPILGKISQIDIYRNGRLQLIFNTANTLYLLDRNGNEVAPYPKKFKKTITQPLAVFDYDQRKRYRIMVTQGNEVTMLEAKGKVVRGFDFKGTKSPLVLPPKHIRLGPKDYLLFAEKNGKLSIQDRVGRSRITVADKINFSENSWYGYKGQFVSLTEDGHFIAISQKGKITTSAVGLDKASAIATTSKTLVTLSENKLTIKGNTFTLDFGTYGKPQIFYINDKIYVTVTDLEAKKVYLYDSNGMLLPNFPVYGQSPMSLGNMDKDSNLEFAVQGEENSILIYEIN